MTLVALMLTGHGTGCGCRELVNTAGVIRSCPCGFEDGNGHSIGVGFAGAGSAREASRSKLGRISKSVGMSGSKGAR